MKKLLSLLLALALLVSLAGCAAAGQLEIQSEPSLQVDGTTEPLFWPPLPEDTQSTDDTALDVTSPSQAPGNEASHSGTASKPAGSTDADIDATYYPREEEDEPIRQEQSHKPVVQPSSPGTQDPQPDASVDDDSDLDDPRPDDSRPDDELPPEQESEQVPEQSLPAQTDPTTAPTESTPTLDPNKHYNSKDDVALYVHLYGKLPGNFYTKKQAERLFGWIDGRGDPLDKYAPGMSIGGDRFHNREGNIPDGIYYECDIGTVGASSRGSKRIVFSTDGTVYYTSNHYRSFIKLYGPR